MYSCMYRVTPTASVGLGERYNNNRNLHWITPGLPLSFVFGKSAVARDTRKPGAGVCLWDWAGTEKESYIQTSAPQKPRSWTHLSVKHSLLCYNQSKEIFKHDHNVDQSTVWFHVIKTSNNVDNKFSRWHSQVQSQWMHSSDERCQPEFFWWEWKLYSNLAEIFSWDHACTRTDRQWVTHDGTAAETRPETS